MEFPQFLKGKSPPTLSFKKVIMIKPNNSQISKCCGYQSKDLLPNVFKFHFQKENVYCCNLSSPSLHRRMNLWISYNHRNWNTTRWSWRLLAITSILVQQFRYLERQKICALQQEKQTRTNAIWNWILEIIKLLPSKVLFYITVIQHHPHLPRRLFRF